MKKQRVLLSSIGTRGDVQPLLALALELKALGHEPRLCVAPNFKPWVESFGVECIPIGPDLEEWIRKPAVKPTPEQIRTMDAGAVVRSQFPVILEAATGCDVMLGAGTLQFAAPSITEKLGIPYVFAAYCPAVFPSPQHPPTKIDERFARDLPADANLALWSKELASWDQLFLTALNDERAKHGLAAVAHVHRHVITERPWLAADAVLGPVASDDPPVLQTGAWLLRDRAPLPEPIEQFLAAGAPPVYFGFGSMRGGDQASGTVLDVVRALGVRAIVSRGWSNLEPQSGDDLLVIDDVAHEALFPRVAAVVHHGGAGTTTTAARAGRPQVLVPHNYDQFYWAHRVIELGIGSAVSARDQLTVELLASAVRTALRPDPVNRSAEFASHVRSDGAAIAARDLVQKVTG